MALQSEIHSAPSALSRLSAASRRALIALGRAFEAYAEARTHAQEFERLNRMSDAELADMGLKRDDIPRFVFRHMI